ncbi:hypothetical protein cypCar_00045708, partial [Cyprinus carpio]
MAEVVCRELDCGAPVQVLGAAAFGKGDAQMWTQEIQCRGNESQIHLCTTSPSHDNNCSHDNDVGLESGWLEVLAALGGYTDLRLVNGPDICSGRISTLVNGHNWFWRGMKSGLMCLIVTGMKQNSQNVPSLHGVELNVLIDEMLESSALVSPLTCPSSPWGQNDCVNEVTKVTCSEDQTRESPQSLLTCFTSPSPHQRQCT